MGRYHGNPYSFVIPLLARQALSERMREREKRVREGDGDREIEGLKGRSTDAEKGRNAKIGGDQRERRREMSENRSRREMERVDHAYW